MNKLFTKIASLSVGLALAVGVGVALGGQKSVTKVKATEALYAEATFAASEASASVGGYQATWTSTHNSFVWNIENFNNNNLQWDGYIKCGRKNTASVANVSTAAAVTEKVSRVTITIDALTASKINSITLYDGSSADAIDNSLGTFTAATGVKSLSIAESAQAANKFYRIEFDCASGSSNGLLTLSNVSLYYEEASEGPFHVTYDGNGATSGSMTDSEEYDNGDTVTIMACGFMRTDYEVIGWNTKADGTGTPYVLSGQFTITGNITLYAQWEYVGKGSPTNPYTVAEARAAIDAAGTATISDRCVAGIICQIDSYSSQWKSIQYWISDDGSTTNALEVYSGKGLNGADFSSKDDLTLKYSVVVRGDLKKFNTTYEFDKSSQILSYTAPQIVSVDGIASAPESIYVGQELLVSEVLLNVTYSSGVHSTINPTSIVLDTSEAGEDVQGTAYYGEVGSATFTIDVVEKDFSGEHVLSSNATEYIANLTNELFHANVENSEAFTLVDSTNFRLYGSPNTGDFMMYNAASVTLSAPAGYVITKVAAYAYAGDSKDATLTIGGIAHAVSSTATYWTYENWVFGNSVTITSSSRIWANTITITLAKVETSSVCNAFLSAFLNMTAEECTALNVTEGTWANIMTVFSHIEADYPDEAELVKEASEYGAAIERYKFIIEKYGYTDFLSKGYVQLSPRFAEDLTLASSNTTMIIIVAIAAVSVVSLAALLIIKKRKHN